MGAGQQDDMKSVHELSPGTVGHGTTSVARRAPVACQGQPIPRGQRRRRQWHIQSLLHWIVLSCILPSVAMAGFLIVQSYQSQRVELELSTVGTARALMQAVDWELTDAQLALEILATSPYLESGNLAGFQAQALTVLAIQTFNNVVLSDASGQQLVNTLKPFGEALPLHGNPDQLKRVIETGRPAVSDLLLGSVARQYLIGIEVPVTVHGRRVYGLAAGLLPARLGEVLRRHQLPAGQVAVILDSTGRKVARSRDSEQVIGQQAPPQVLRRLSEAPEGTVDIINRASAAVFVSFSRSALSRWSVVIAVPDTDLTSALQKSACLGAAVASAMVLLGLLWARTIGSRITRSIEALQAPALALASDHAPGIPESDIIEVSLVGDALILASRLLDQRRTEREIATAEIRDALHRLTERSAELERSNAELDQFAHVASHDLKAPLRGIAHLAQWIAGDVAATASPETTTNLTLLQSRVARMQMLLDGLLAYSRVGRLQSAVEDVDVAEVVRDVVAMLAPPPGFIVACEGTMPSIRTYRTPIQIMLENLIGNALKHHDRAEGRVIVTMRLVDGVAEFRVSDDGPGIPPQFHDRIFVMFHTLANRDDVESSGLGLAIVKKQVEALGGHIRVESAPPARGTSFVFTWHEDTGVAAHAMPPQPPRSTIRSDFPA
jgi:signal transduction histidine kinase